jgi:hypothetical protein
LTLSSNTHARPIENLVVTISLGEETTSVSATASGDSRGLLPGGGGKNPAFPVGGQGGGNWDFDPLRKVLRWSIGELAGNEKPASLVGSFVCRYEAVFMLGKSKNVLRSDFIPTFLETARRIPQRLHRLSKSTSRSTSISSLV